MKEFIRGMYEKPRFAKRFLFCFVAVCLMGFCVSWLELISFGTDPCSVLAYGISGKLGISYGNWLAAFNCVLLIAVIIWGRNNIGFGTVLNMFLVGYSCDFTTWLRGKLFPELVLEELWLRILLMVVVLALFVFVAAVYMSVDLGTAPYDAIPFLISQKTDKLSFRVIRIIWDCAAMAIGFALGATAGIVTLAMAFALGPAIAFVKKHIEKYLN